jgi:hypothetical protein
MPAIESGKVNPLIKWALAVNAQQFIPVLDTIDILSYDARKFKQQKLLLNKHKSLILELLPPIQGRVNLAETEQANNLITGTWVEVQ